MSSCNIQSQTQVTNAHFKNQENAKKKNQQKQKQDDNIFLNDNRVNALIDSVQRANRERMMELIEDRTVNSKVYKKLKGKSVTWDDLKDEVVWHIVDAVSNSNTVMKTFDEDDFPFHEIVGNILGTSLLKSAGPFFVRLYDVGKFVDTGEYFILMEYLPHDTEELDLEDPVIMYNLFYQICYCIHNMSMIKHQLQHFDLRFDNIMIKKLPPGKKRDLFNNGYCVSDFIVKIGDWGQCEFNWDEKLEQDNTSNMITDTESSNTSASKTLVTTIDGLSTTLSRPTNENIPREDEYRKKWGVYPETYSHGYDFQYFMGTLTPVLDNLQGLSFYYVYNMVMDYMQPMTFTTAQDRPEIITKARAINIFNFLKKDVFPTLDFQGEDINKENKSIL